MDGHPLVCRTMGVAWDDVCERLLGVRPPRSVVRGYTLSMPWLFEIFDDLPAGVDDIVILRWIRDYILLLIGGVMFSDKT